ncbi:hypothetical protein CDAR_405601 [Caerostris darwini]|uniref:Uncharacterized protein n=1 Tax=Caerostris darwini TaxID=1538125 RepID=A0AAV4NYI1_9ARAC|nr:hypothetical protein CDAR_405601 [Caerostris darwini]
MEVVKRAGDDGWSVGSRAAAGFRGAATMPGRQGQQREARQRHDDVDQRQRIPHGRDTLHSKNFYVINL